MSTAAYAQLRGMERRLFTTAEAAARMSVTPRTAGDRLNSLQRQGLALRVIRGVWTLEENLDPAVAAPYLTYPYPAYVSIWSALAKHGMIEQIPRQVSVVSLSRPRRIVTKLGVFAIHQISGGLFDGYTGDERSGYLASPEKAVFDTVYVRAAALSRASFPELTFPADFEPQRLLEWLDRIDSARLRSVVARRVEEVLALS